MCGIVGSSRGFLFLWALNEESVCVCVCVCVCERERERERGKSVKEKKRKKGNKMPKCY